MWIVRSPTYSPIEGESSNPWGMGPRGKGEISGCRPLKGFLGPWPFLFSLCFPATVMQVVAPVTHSSVMYHVIRHRPKATKLAATDLTI